MKFQKLLLFSACFILASSCNVLEEKHEVSYTNLGISTAEYVILSNLDGELIHHEALESQVKMTYDQMTSNSFHLTSMKLTEAVPSLGNPSTGETAQSAYIKTYLDIPTGDYQPQPLTLGADNSIELTYYIQVNNIGNFTPTETNPFCSRSGFTTNYDPSNGGTLTTTVFSKSKRAYIVFNLDDPDPNNRKYFHQSDVEHGETITIDYSTLPTLTSTETKMMLDDTYTGQLWTAGYNDDGKNQGNIVFKPISSDFQSPINEVTWLMPPFNDFDYFITQGHLHKDGRNLFFVEKSENEASLPETIGMPDWTFNVDNEQFNSTEITTTGDYDYVEVIYEFRTSDGKKYINWTFITSKASLIKIPEIEIPAEIFAAFPFIDNVNDLELLYVSLNARSDMNSYDDYVEATLISNEGYDATDYQRINGK